MGRRRGAESSSEPAVLAPEVAARLNEAIAEDKFWSNTPTLKHVRNVAHSRLVSAYAVLGCVLREAISCVEPRVMLPPITGDVASLNLFTAAVGTSGRGKDAANAAGRAAINFLGMDGENMSAPMGNAGSGEGLARIFAGYKAKNGDIDRLARDARAKLEVPDVATLEALAGRKGQTLVGELLKAYMGQPLGFSNAQRETTTAVAEHSYRLVLGVGVQPDNARFFLDRDKDGLPQRFLWLPATDPLIPKPEPKPEPVEPIDVVLPDFGHGRWVMQIPDEVAVEIREYRWLVVTGSNEVDPLDGHVMLTRAKTAAGLSILHGRNTMEMQDWELAGHLIDVSRAQRDGLAAAVKARKHVDNTAQADAQAEREAIICDRMAEHNEKRVAQAITRKLARVRRATRRDLRINLKTGLRGDFDPVFDTMRDDKVIVCCASEPGQADLYEFGPEYK
jgi:hypothetical protein